jgi:hypothetical protein
MSRLQDRSSRSVSAAITPGDPGPSSLSSILSPHKRKRSISRGPASAGNPPLARRARSASEEDTPRPGGQEEDKEWDELESEDGSTSSPGGGGW